MVTASKNDQLRGVFPMTDQEAKAALELLIGQAWNQGEVALLRSAFHPSFRYHEDFVIGPTRASGMGSPSFSLEVRTNRDAFPDLSFELGDTMAEGDKVVARWRISGTHTGAVRLGAIVGLATLPPSQRRLSARGVSVCRIEAGQIAALENYWYPLSLLQQLVLLERSVDIGQFLSGMEQWGL
jgi:predicted ester cyclase